MITDAERLKFIADNKCYVSFSKYIVSVNNNGVLYIVYHHKPEKCEATVYPREEALKLAIDKAINDIDGHSHGTLPDDPTARSMDVGVDANRYEPLALDDVLVKMYNKSYKPIDHHGDGSKR